MTTRNLEEVTIGTLVGKIGAPPALPQGYDNYFVNPMDQWWCDTATGKTVYESQNPVMLLTELMELYTTPKDWVISSPTDIGMQYNNKFVKCTNSVSCNALLVINALMILWV